MAGICPKAGTFHTHVCIYCKREYGNQDGCTGDPFECLTCTSRFRELDEKEGTVSHLCHWPECGKEVPPAMWGCRPHWFRLPKSLRDRIWATYVHGQEVTKTPSQAYLEAARAVQQWIKLKYPAG
jgi:hypothetical protein